MRTRRKLGTKRARPDRRIVRLLRGLLGLILWKTAPRSPRRATPRKARPPNKPERGRDLMIAVQQSRHSGFVLPVVPFDLGLSPMKHQLQRSRVVDVERDVHQVLPRPPHHHGRAERVPAASARETRSRRSSAPALAPDCLQTTSGNRRTARRLYGRPRGTEC